MSPCQSCHLMRSSSVRSRVPLADQAVPRLWRTARARVSRMVMWNQSSTCSPQGLISSAGHGSRRPPSVRKVMSWWPAGLEDERGPSVSRGRAQLGCCVIGEQSLERHVVAGPVHRHSGSGRSAGSPGGPRRTGCGSDGILPSRSQAACRSLAVPMLASQPRSVRLDTICCWARQARLLSLREARSATLVRDLVYAMSSVGSEPPVAGLDV
jgi:hypothetical protein